METIIMSYLITILFIITWIVIDCNSCNDCPTNFQSDILFERMKRENERLEREYNYIKQQMDYEKYRLRPGIYYPTCFCKCFCNKPPKSFYGKTPDDQKVADLLKEISVKIEDVAEKLDIKIL